MSGVTGGRIQWPCAICREAIRDGDGWLVIDRVRGTACRYFVEEGAGEWSDIARWEAMHDDCRPAGHEWFGWQVEALRSSEDLLLVASTVAGTPWMRYTNWSTVLFNAWRRLQPRQPLSATERDAIFVRDSHRCQACGFQNLAGKRLHVDHIYPLALGGTDLAGNLQTLCDRCNNLKGIKTMERFLRECGLESRVPIGAL